MSRAVLPPETVEAFAKEHGWKIDNQTLVKNLEFESFVEAFNFMTLVANEAENVNHHPDWCNSYNRVNLSLTTHDSGGITQLDLDLAKAVEEIYLEVLEDRG